MIYVQLNLQELLSFNQQKMHGEHKNKALNGTWVIFLNQDHNHFTPWVS